MRLLLIGPLPPPMTGNALPVKVLYDSLKDEIDIDIINLSKKKHKSGITSLARIFEIFRSLRLTILKQRKNDVVYLSIAESFAGNLRDLAIYWICRKRLKTVVLHMLGGAGMANILRRTSSFQYKINRYFLSRVGGIVVEGRPQFNMFSKVASPERIHIVPNFAEDFLFTNEETIAAKFHNPDPLQILFLSNMLPGKGHVELLEAFLSLDEDVKKNVRLTFAGKPVSEKNENWLKRKIMNITNIRYLGPVYGEDKRKLFTDSHIFCLPTYYAYEGQPFSIIEAYATGCAVITTDHSGIRFIFRDQMNGYFVEKQSVGALARLLARVVAEKGNLCSIALNNLKQSKELYTSKQYIQKMKEIITCTLHA